MSAIAFRKLEKSDLPLMHEWLNRPHMRAFYQRTPVLAEEIAAKYIGRIEGRDGTFCHIALLDGRPFGKIQCYLNRDNPAWAAVIGAGDGISVDLFIGEPELIGKGFGHAMLRAYMDIAFSLFPGETRCYICHEKANEAACHASEAAGFMYLRGAVEEGRDCRLLMFKKKDM
jgi:aminoglycoside 6'-N-acetyltransferase